MEKKKEYTYSKAPQKVKENDHDHPCQEIN
jgi:hypothetical protein